MVDPAQLMADLEACLSTIYASGEWTDDHDAMLGRWRAARGEEGKTSWAWWAGMVGDEIYANELASRDAAIAWARMEYPHHDIEVIEARCWNDGVQGDDGVWFAETRCHEVIPAEAQSHG